MSKEQGKPTEKSRDFLTIILVFVTIIAILLAVFLSPDTVFDGPPPDCQDCAYNTNQVELKNSIAEYASRNEGTLPILNGTYTVTECSNCSVINISAVLVANGGMLRKVPDSCNLSITGNDNCGGNADLGCSNKGSYIWLTDIYGNVFSYCAGAGCTTNNSDYQDVWP